MVTMITCEIIGYTYVDVWEVAKYSLYSLQLLGGLFLKQLHIELAVNLQNRMHTQYS